LFNDYEFSAATVADKVELPTKNAATLAADGHSFAVSYGPPRRGHPPVRLRQGGVLRGNNNGALKGQNLPASIKD